MKEQRITFKTAKLAKEKGFIDNCSYYYSNKDRVLKPFMFDDNPKVISLCNGKEFNLLTIAPTQSLLQKWLREKHNITIWFEDWNDNKYGIHVNQSDETMYMPNMILGTFEQALEQGLQEALKLI